MTRSGWIDALRGAAACAVALFHFNEPEVTWTVPAWLEAWKAFWKFGHAGVPVFFVLSGYCIGATALRAPSVPDFLVRRGRRIFPAYWASVLLIVLLAVGRRAATGVNDLASIPRSALDWLATATLTTAPVTSVKTINWVYWSLSFELAFYGLVALALFQLQPARRAAALALISSLVVGLALYHAPPSGPLFFLRLWPLFALGLVPLLLRAHPGPALLVGAGCALHIVVGAVRGEELLYPSIALVVVLALFACQRIERPAPGALRSIGEWSYSIYLLHVPLACYALRWLTGPPTGAWADVGLQVVQLALTLAVGALSYRYLERPFLQPKAVAPLLATAQP